MHKPDITYSITRINGLVFSKVPLAFSGVVERNVFARKNNSTLRKTLQSRRYKKIAKGDRFSDLTEEELNTPLGEFLMDMKNSGDASYMMFLNDYGDLEYTSFAIVEKNFQKRKGIYTYFVGGELKYIGRCVDNMKTRVNNGYGRISPKNCYKDGQSTNCRINNQIRGADGEVTLWLHEMDDRDAICKMEQDLIKSLSPPWNIQQWSPNHVMVAA